jgi:hypothetical protein
MGQQRRNQRFLVANALNGTFLNREKFLIKDISYDGMHLLSNFSPIIGSNYLVTVTDSGKTQRLELLVVRVNAGSYNLDDTGGIPVGVLYSVGARLLNITEDRQKFIQDLMYKHT